MTICVGILCSDGVIIASDTMASTNILGMNNRKIYQLPFGVCGVAGSDFLGKFFIHKLNNFPSVVSHDPYEFTTVISEIVKQQIYHSNPGIQTNINAMMLNSMQRNELNVFVNFCAILGFTSNNNFYLANFQAAINNSLFGACITKSDDKIFWQIIGSGYATSAPLVKLLCDMLKINDKPNLKQGKILAYWLVKYAIDNASQYVGGNVDILQLTNNNSNVTTITNIDFSECEGLRAAIMSHIDSYHKPATDNPEIPTL